MIECWSRGSTEDHMDETILLDLADLIEKHPWWRARASLTIALLKRLGIAQSARVLDAGCGWGVTLLALEKSGFESVGLDVSRRALQRLDSSARSLVEADLTRPFTTNLASFDAVLALDVIEHLDDDRCAVANLATLLKPGGVLIVSVPALPEMYSEFDAIQGHRRRYDVESLSSAFDKTGLDVERISWWGQWLHGRLNVSRHESRGRPGDSPSEVYRRYLELPAWPFIQVIRLLFALEKPRALKGRLDRGTSLFAIARRPSVHRSDFHGWGMDLGSRDHATPSLVSSAEYNHQRTVRQGWGDRDRL